MSSCAMCGIVLWWLDFCVVLCVALRCVAIGSKSKKKRLVQNLTSDDAPWFGQRNADFIKSKEDHEKYRVPEIHQALGS